MVFPSSSSAIVVVSNSSGGPTWFQKAAQARVRLLSDAERTTNNRSLIRESVRIRGYDEKIRASSVSSPGSLPKEWSNLSVGDGVT